MFFLHLLHRFQVAKRFLNIILELALELNGLSAVLLVQLQGLHQGSTAASTSGNIHTNTCQPQRMAGTDGQLCWIDSCIAGTASAQVAGWNRCSRRAGVRAAHLCTHAHDGRSYKGVQEGHGTHRVMHNGISFDVIQNLEGPGTPHRRKAYICVTST